MSLFILIVDDDADDLEFFREAMGEIDATAECATALNGEDALRFLNTTVIKKPDHIFLDLNMPRMNGKQFLKEIKKLPKFSDIPVTIYTTSKLSEDKVETKKLGAVHFISKPTKFIDLCNAISFVISKKWNQEFSN